MLYAHAYFSVTKQSYLLRDVNSWTQNRLGSAKGGPYLGVHLRRKDFIWGHREDVPSLKGAVKKIRSLMKKHKLHQVFVATDADGEGTDTIKKTE